MGNWGGGIGIGPTPPYIYFGPPRSPAPPAGSTNTDSAPPPGSTYESGDPQTGGGTLPFPVQTPVSPIGPSPYSPEAGREALWGLNAAQAPVQGAAYEPGGPVQVREGEPAPFLGAGSSPATGRIPDFTQIAAPEPGVTPPGYVDEQAEYEKLILTGVVAKVIFFSVGAMVSFYAAYCFLPPPL